MARRPQNHAPADVCRGSTPSESIRTQTPLQPAVETIYQAAFRPTFDRICGHSPKRLDLISTRAEVPGQVGHNARLESCTSTGANALRSCMAILDSAPFHAANVDPPAAASKHGRMHAQSCDKEYQASLHPSGHIWLVSRSHESSLAALTKTSTELSVGASQIDSVPLQHDPCPQKQQKLCTHPSRALLAASASGPPPHTRANTQDQRQTHVKAKRTLDRFSRRGPYQAQGY